MLKRVVFLLLIGTASAFVVAAEPAREPRFAARCRTLRNCAETKRQFLGRRADEELRAAATDEERRQVQEQALEQSAELMARFDRLLLDELASEADDPAAVETLVWIVQTRLSAFADEAAELLATFHPTRQETIDLAVRNAGSPMRWVEPLLRAQVRAVPPADANHARVLSALAAQKQSDGRLARRLSEMSDDAVRELRLLYGDETIEACRRIDPAGAETEAVRLFTRLERRHGTRKATAKATFGRIARSAIFEIRRLSVGRIAPELEGEDIEGRPLRLGAFRGKVVLLSFWASWCGPCMAQVPHEKRIVDRFAEKAFVLIGVNADQSRTKAASEAARAGISWRSFWCGADGPEGEIPFAWNVTAWPTRYLIDHRGVIRAKDPDDEALERLLDELVAQAESTDSPRKRGVCLGGRFVRGRPAQFNAGGD